MAKTSSSSQKVKLRAHTFQMERGPYSVAQLIFETSKEGCAMDVFHESILGTLDGRVEYDLLLGPEWSYFSQKSGPLSKKRKQKFLEEICTATRGKKTLVVPGSVLWKPGNNFLRNTAYFIKDGSIIWNYDKIKDGGDSIIAMRFGLAYKNGRKKGLFQDDDYYYGIEICADRGSLEEHLSTSSLDLLLRPCCGLYTPKKEVSPRFPRYIKPGGLFLVNEGDVPCSYSVQKPISVDVVLKESGSSSSKRSKSSGLCRFAFPGGWDLMVSALNESSFSLINQFSLYHHRKLCAVVEADKYHGNTLFGRTEEISWPKIRSYILSAFAYRGFAAEMYSCNIRRGSEETKAKSSFRYFILMKESGFSILSTRVKRQDGLLASAPQALDELFGAETI